MKFQLLAITIAITAAQVPCTTPRNPTAVRVCAEDHRGDTPGFCACLKKALDIGDICEINPSYGCPAPAEPCTTPRNPTAVRVCAQDHRGDQPGFCGCVKNSFDNGEICGIDPSYGC